jgi:hypothetical protein
MKVLAVISGIVFHPKPSEHTVMYDKNARQASRDSKQDWKLWEGQFKAAVGTYEECVKLLAADVKDYLENNWWKLNAKDFTFTVVYTEFKDNRAWLIPCTSQCGINGHQIP